MSYYEILLYQERSMRDQLNACWFAFRSERETFKQATFDLIGIAVRYRKGWRRQ